MGGWTIAGVLRALAHQVRAHRLTILVCYLGVAFVFGLMIAARIFKGIEIGVLTRDPAQLAGVPVYTGALSNVGVLIWAGTAAVCLYSAALIHRGRRRQRSAAFLFAAGSITTWLLVDDFFMLHEIVLPQYLGVPQEVDYGLMLLALLTFLIGFASTIMGTDFVLLGIALAAFGVSIGSDVFEPHLRHIVGYYLFEDGAKFFGIVNWSAYFIITSAKEVTSSVLVPISRPELLRTPAVAEAAGIQGWGRWSRHG